MITAGRLRAKADAQAATLPPLMAQAEHLAQTILLGDHGRRRAGTGESFWQYRPAQPHDSARQIDWRRSARSDANFVQDKEWQIAQSVQLWVDLSPGMQFCSAEVLPSKAERAALLGLATAILLDRGGERVGLTSPALPPKRGAAQLIALAQHLAPAIASDSAPNDDSASGETGGAPDVSALLPQATAVMISDFLGPFAPVEAALQTAAERGVYGVLLQVLDPQEEQFPFDGRTIFESMTGAVAHETLKAGGLKTRYLDRLAARKDKLAAATRTAGWTFEIHRTDHSATDALLWLYRALERQR